MLYYAGRIPPPESMNRRQRIAASALRPSLGWCYDFAR